MAKAWSLELGRDQLHCTTRSFVVQPYVPGINKLIFNDPATIVYWNDGTKTVVKCREGDTFSEEYGLMAAIAKKYFGQRGKMLKLIENSR